MSPPPAEGCETGPVAISIPDLCVDLVAETVVLTECVAAGIRRDGEAAGDTPTPAPNWNVRDQIVHLAFFDEAVTTAVLDPTRFEAEREALRRRPEGVAEAAAAISRGSGIDEAIDRFATSRAALIRAFMEADPAARVPWYGPTMSVGSALTARIMETWAHGQDVFDGYGFRHPATSAVRQVAHIGVRALPNSYVGRGLGVPADPVFVGLTAPDGSEWTWGPADARNRVSGPAVDFCLVVTQRRHLDDTALVVDGDIADEWMHIAQAFAGPVGDGRASGQFA
jgi:uncharacterized protein (TIGR03084 family)